MTFFNIDAPTISDFECLRLLFRLGDAAHDIYSMYEATPLDTLLAPPWHLIVARDPDRCVVGCGALNEETGEIGRVFVVEPERRKGVASAMMDELERRARTGGLKATHLSVALHNWAAFFLYQSRGYRWIKSLKNEFRAIEFLIMERELDLDYLLP